MTVFTLRYLPSNITCSTIQKELSREAQPFLI